MSATTPHNAKPIPAIAFGMLLFFFLHGSTLSFSQKCPANIDFETGTFDGWTCYTGLVSAVNQQNVISLSPSGGPVDGRHTMYTRSALAQVDPYGKFSVNCPNGSGHSVRLGNDAGGGQAEGISYEFTIPADRDEYSIIYHYAVVFQDPNHEKYQQPRLEIEISNVTDNLIIGCSSFTFFPYGSILPGFFESTDPGGETPVWCKDWTANSINLNNMAGKTVKLMFKTSDCTFRRHFGYAYVDVNSGCGTEFAGAAFCKDDSLVNVIAPFGYENYTWFDKGLTTKLGSGQVLSLKPPPPSGTVLAVEVTPYTGYGCPQTLYTKVVDSLNITAMAGPDAVSCNNKPVQLGIAPELGMIYSWSPVTGLSDPNIANPFASPNATIAYVLKQFHDGGGCLSFDTVVVQAASASNAIQVLGKTDFCENSGDSAVLEVSYTDSIQWYKNGNAIPGATASRYKVTASGLYSALLKNTFGCSFKTVDKPINISPKPKADFTVNNPVQCLGINQFLFTNNSTTTTTQTTYSWNLGDSNFASSKNLTYSYKIAGNFTVKMVVKNNAGCGDSSTTLVKVLASPIANFTATPVCEKLPVTLVNLTVDSMFSVVKYTWTFGNGTSSTLKNPPPIIYSTGGNYTISLSASSTDCPFPNILQKIIGIETEKPGIRYAEQYPVSNYPLTLHARQIGQNINWQPGIFLNDTKSYNPVYKGNAEQEYTLLMTTALGCKTVDTLLVKPIKQAEIYVPSGFTPNGDGKNDNLKPLLLGISELRYFRIFDRWGKIVFESKTALPGWNGRYNGIEQPSQTLVWMVEGVGIDGTVIVKKGTTVLIR